MTDAFPFDDCVERLKALGEPTRLRIVLLLAHRELTVSDLVAILGQSQPRVSRHLRLLVETRILRRHQEGAWAYFHLADDRPTVDLVATLAADLDPADPVRTRDAHRLADVLRQRADHAAAYFAANAERWDRIRSLHVPDSDVEAALVAELGEGGVDSLLDIGTGTGRMLELLAPGARRAVGVDASREMLAIARAKLDEAGLGHAMVRQGDAYNLPVETDAFDLVTLHQVLHYLADPQGAVQEAARRLRPGGRLAIVDFAPHANEFLREEHAHLRLGFSEGAIGGFLKGAGLTVERIRSLAPPGARADELTVIVAIGRDGRTEAAAATPSIRRIA